MPASRNDIYKMVRLAKRTFLSSDRPEREKCKLREMRPIIIFNRLLKKSWGQAMLVHQYDSQKAFYGLSKDMPIIKAEGRSCWAVLDINPLIIFETRKDVYDTVAHELAHLLDFLVGGKYYIRYERFHSDRWREIHMAMGGNGETGGPKIHAYKSKKETYVERKINELFK